MLLDSVVLATWPGDDYRESVVQKFGENAFMGISQQNNCTFVQTFH